MGRRRNERRESLKEWAGISEHTLCVHKNGHIYSGSYNKNIFTGNLPFLISNRLTYLHNSGIHWKAASVPKSEMNSSSDEFAITPAATGLP